MVGRPLQHRADLTALLNRMTSGQTPSTLRAILGPNGNGKTLINHALQEAATKINLGEGSLSFKVLFSRISVADATGHDMGLRLASGLARSIREDPATTFTLLSAQVLNRFALSYRPPFWRRLLPGLARGLLRKFQKIYDDYAKDIIDLADSDPVEKGLNRIEGAIRDILTDRSMRMAFAEYARGHEMGSVLTRFLVNRGERALSTKALNAALREELINQQRGLNAKEAVHTLAKIAQEVECRVLLLMIDDCNDRPGQDYVLRLADALGEFDNPKLLVVASGLDAAWKKRIQEDGYDRSFDQKVRLFGEELAVPPPNDSELQQLADKLVTIVNSESYQDGRRVAWDDAAREKAVGKCQGKSYRESTRLLMKEIKQHVAG